MIRYITAAIFVLTSSFCFAGAISVEFKEKGAGLSDAPTINFVWPAKQAKATLIFIPGGEGRLGITNDRANLGGFYGATLKPLSDEKITSGNFNVVVFDSPVNLPGTDWPHSRQSQEHLLRIESVVRHFKNLYSLPVWVMGHSNGAVSITAFYKMLQDSGAESLVKGAIYSSGRNGADFTDTTKLPILFLAHERDACKKSEPSSSKVVFEKQSKTNTMKLKYFIIKGGESQPQNPCSSGFHMFNGAAQEAYSAIEAFVIDVETTK